jgi:hypothetical protein
MFEQAVLELGGDDFFRYNAVAEATGVGNTPQILANLSQLKTLLHEATPLEMVGTDAGDVAVVFVVGINGDRQYVEELHVLTGLTPVDIGSWFRVMRIEYASGLPLVGGAVIYDPAEGTGTLTDPGTFLYAPAMFTVAPVVEAARSYDSGFMVPAGYEGYTKGFKFLADKAVEFGIAVQARNTIEPAMGWQTILIPRVSASVVDYNFGWRRIPQHWETRVIIQRNSGSQNAAVTLDFQVIMVRKAA